MMGSELNFIQPLLQPWEDPVFEKKSLQVDVLRLDRVHPVLGGNKWMKLRGFLQQAIHDGKKGILTKGGPWSNHVHATAWACQQAGLTCSIWVKGYTGMRTSMLTDAQHWGAVIHFVDRNLFYDEMAARAFTLQNNLLYIPMGGADQEGVMETTRFLQNLPLPKYTHAACAVGTATTFGGLAFIPDNFPMLLGIDAGTNDEAVVEKVATWQRELCSKNLQLISEFSFGGFAKRTPELVDFANQLYQRHAIPTDLVYTAKLFFAIRQLAQQDYFPAGSSVMVLHSGGLQGNRSLPMGLLQF